MLTQLLAALRFEDGETEVGERERAPRMKPEEGGNGLERVNRGVWGRTKGAFVYSRAITYGNVGGGR